MTPPAAKEEDDDEDGEGEDADAEFRSFRRSSEIFENRRGGGMSFLRDGIVGIPDQTDCQPC